MDGYIEEYLSKGSSSHWTTSNEKFPLPNEIFNDAQWWHRDRGITSTTAQLVKVVEEVGELAQEVSHCTNDKDAIADAIGDSMIALIGMAEVEGLDAVSCLQLAWTRVKNRTGKIVDGHFVKDV